MDARWDGIQFNRSLRCVGADEKLLEMQEVAIIEVKR